ncbi:MAG: hypothetical protein B6D39_11185 [Anaerolineae bacterium UTCFX2]|jgi:hypothetical protein|nr:hypothetical protein [Anaerolineae bacterium]MCZ7551312.1 hypothetical protein [Anaerolineales bacterium]OQY88347.1 MAG: hypothetical protein B6D39_11185 [Anaerolineae bacterium UTCFX2]
MDADPGKRIDLAWRECQTWIAEFDGSPRLALLVDAPLEALAPGMLKLAEQVESLRLTRLPARDIHAPEYFALVDFSNQLEKLSSGETAELSANFAARAAAFDLDLHLVFHPVKENRLALEFVWWSDQVFSSETDNRAQFQALMEYFVRLQQMFQANGLFLSLENGLGNEDAWVEV